MQWLDDKGTVYVPPNTTLVFRAENAVFAVWWHDNGGETGLGTGELLGGAATNVISNPMVIPLTLPRNEGDRIGSVHLRGGIEILVLREDFWIVKGHEYFSGSFLRRL